MLHGALLVVGAAFLLTGAFHGQVWFDESYSVAIADKSFANIWRIGSSDVHPVLFYWALHVLQLITGGDIAVYRIFTVAGAVATAALGLTHLRRDFGYRIGLLFSFLALFMPYVSFLSIEIRMYSWATFCVMLAWIYAYRIIRLMLTRERLGRAMKPTGASCRTGAADGTLSYSGGRKAAGMKAVPLPTPLHFWVVFFIASICAAYLHYFSLLSAFIINAMLLVFLIAKRSSAKRDLIIFVVQAAVQVALFAPWLIVLFNQVGVVSNSYWVNFAFPDTLFQIVRYPLVTMQVTYAAVGDYGEEAFIFIIALGVVAALFALWVAVVLVRRFRAYRHRRNECSAPRRHVKDVLLSSRNLGATLALSTYIALLVIVVAASVILGSSMLYPRYLFVCIGPLLLFTAWVFVSIDSKAITAVFCVLFLILSLFHQVLMLRDDYSSANTAFADHLEENWEVGDLVVSSDIGIEGVTSVELPYIPQYYLNWQGASWGAAYEAYAPTLKIIKNWNEVLDGYQGTIWVLGATTSSKTPTDVRDLSSRDDVDIISKQCFFQPYDRGYYTILRLEKN